MKMPKAPDPYATAAAQTKSNVDTATANSIIQNADEISPYGNVTYREIGRTDVGGNSVPRYERTVSLSPGQQTLYDQQTAMEQQLNKVAGEQLNRVGGLLSSPINVPRINQPITTDFSADRKRVEDAMYARLEPQIQRDRDAMLSRLQNQGVTEGSEAYKRAVDAYGRQANDARNQVVLSGGQEQSRLYELEQAARQQAIQEALSMRNQPINEISTLMNGGQVTLPQFAQYRPGTVAPTDVMGAVYKSYDLNRQNAQAQMGGIGGLAGTLLTLPMGGMGGSLGGRLFGGLFR